MKVFVITAGRYSDYHIIAICDNRALAEKTIFSMEDAAISEWCLNDLSEITKNGLFKYFIEMDKEGNTLKIEKQPEAYISNESALFASGDYLSGYVLARDEKHAIKTVNEKRLQMIASNEWKQ